MLGDVFLSTRFRLIQTATPLAIATMLASLHRARTAATRVATATSGAACSDVQATHGANGCESVADVVDSSDSIKRPSVVPRASSA
jgi:hypothetical protein